MLNAKRIPLPNISEHDVILLQADLMQQLDKVSELYLKPGSKRDKPLVVQPILEPKPNSAINSKIIH
jgi:hypothetical protein